MPLKHYGVLKGRVIDRRPGTGQNPHYQLHMIDDVVDYRIAVNVLSQLSPSELEYLIDSQFRHPVLAGLEDLKPGWHQLESKPGKLALDFIRGNLLDPRRMTPLAYNVPGPDNDLNEKLDHYIQRALADENSYCYAFGERWGPEGGKKDKIFGFLPGNGVHDIHMNQGNDASFKKDDGVYQDGALLLHFPSQGQWIGIFLKFQSQTWHTDDKTGHRLTIPVSGPPSIINPPPTPFQPGGLPSPETPDGAVRIVGALVNAIKSPEVETVTLLNTTGGAIDLAGWKLLDRDKHAMSLQGVIPAGDTLKITLVPPAALPNKGGMITILNEDGLRVDGVSYTKAQASAPGYTIKF